MPLCKCYVDWLNIVQVRILPVNTHLPSLLLKFTRSQKMGAVEKCYFVQIRINTFFPYRLIN